MFPDEEGTVLANNEQLVCSEMLKMVKRYYAVISIIGTSA